MLYYNGVPCAATSSQTFQTIDPSTGTPISEVQVASPSDIDGAIASAHSSFSSWSRTPVIARSRILLRAVTLLRERNDEIAKIETQDTGKPFSETSAVDVVTGADVLEYYANLVGGGGLNGEIIQLREDAWVYSRKEALGVCVGIGAWNYPIQMYAIMTIYINHTNGEDEVQTEVFVQSSVEIGSLSGCGEYYGLQAK